MNNKRREILRGAINSLKSAERSVNIALDEEMDCLDNLPENMEGGDRYEKMEAAIDKLENAIESINEAIGCIEEAAS